MQTANPPKSDDGYVHGSVFIINDFLRNPHFKEIQIGSDQKTIKNDKKRLFRIRSFGFGFLGTSRQEL